jgi:putative ubiquitin-RnfH superfamily antitoxin RatB of RatAB toxin-antitoxin module
MRIEIAYAAPGVEALLDVHVGPGAVVADAIALSGLVARLNLDPARLSYAIHGQRATPDTPLRDGDRVELLRSLIADPKSIRRARALSHPLPRAAKPPRRGRRTGGNSG